MAKGRKKTSIPPKYATVAIAGLRQTRNGKHHDLMGGIFEEIENLEPGRALKVPMDGIGGVTLENLRSAIHRTATGKKFRVETIADGGNFYVWKRPTSKE